MDAPAGAVRGERCSFAAERRGAVDIRYLKGVGEKRAAQLAKLGICTTEDLLGFYPRDHIDYSHPYTVAGAPYVVKFQ